MEQWLSSVELQRNRNKRAHLWGRMLSNQRCDVCSRPWVWGQEMWEASAEAAVEPGHGKQLSFLVCLQPGKEGIRKPRIDSVFLFIVLSRNCRDSRKIRIVGFRWAQKLMISSSLDPSWILHLWDSWVRKADWAWNSWGDFKTCWNHPGCDCCFPIAEPDENLQSICEQWSKKSNERSEQALPNTEGKTAFYLHNKNISPLEFLLVCNSFIESSKTLSWLHLLYDYWTFIWH